MSWIKKNFFGGAEKEAAKQQIAAGDRAMATQKEYYDQARGDIMKLFPQAYQGIATSYQQAIDQIGAGRVSSADLLRQAFNQSNQITQSGSNAALSALLGRPQMQLPQAAPSQMAGQMQPRNAMMTTGLRGAQSFQNQSPIGVTDTLRPDDQMFGGMQTMQTMQMGLRPDDVPMMGVGMSNPNQPMIQTTAAPSVMPQQGLTAPTMQPTSLGATPQVQPNVDMSGIGLSGAESALQAGLGAQASALQGGLQGQLGALNQGAANQVGALQGQNLQAQGTLNQVLGGQLGAFQQGSNQAQNTLQQTLGGQLGALNQGFGGAEQALNQYGYQALGAANQGFNQGRADIMGGASQAAGMLAGAQEQGINRIDQSTGQAIGYLNPYASTGAEAQQREAALSGALGGAAQQQAIGQFMESPGQKFLRERQEQALLRNASATGGLRGGSTLSALQEQASGIAAQQQQQQLENMRNIAQRGQQAAGQQGQFAQSGGQAGASLIGNLAQTGAGIMANAGQAAGSMAASGGQFAGNTLNQMGGQISGLRSGLGQLQAGAIGNTGSDVAGLQNQLGGNMAGAIGGVGGNVAGLQNQLGGNLADVYGTNAAGQANVIGQNAGNMANVFGGTANTLAGLRSQAGQNAANQINAQTGQLSNNQLNLGQMLAGLDTNTANQLANLLTQGGTAGAQNQMTLATLLANLATGQGSNMSNIQVGQGNAQAAGTIGSSAGQREGAGAVVGGLLTGGLFSDERLKDNITKLAEGAVDLFAWTWKHIEEIPEALRGTVSVGVIAQQVKDRFPSCVVERDGYYAVNYTNLAQEVANV